MRDPHVEKLRYCLVLAGGDTFHDPPAVERDYHNFRVRLADGLVTVTMKEHHPTIELARSRVEPFLRDWELSAALEYRRRDVTFDYKDADVIDRDPPPPGEPQSIEISAAGVQSMTGTAKITVLRRAYPSPPDRFVSSRDVDRIRYEQYLEGHEPLPSMAYFCLTVVEKSVALLTKKKGRANRPCASSTYGIEPGILDNLGALTSERGDERTARKAHEMESLTPIEENWIREVLIAIIRRLGEYAKDPNAMRSVIKMADLPPLPISSQLNHVSG